MKNKKPSLAEKFKVFSAVLLTLVALIAGLSYAKYSEINQAIQMAASFPEYYEVVEKTSVEISEHRPTVRVLGKATSPLHSQLLSELPGKVVHIDSQPGAKVKKGDLLFQIDISAEKAQLASAKAREIHAKTIFSRSEKLLKKKAVSQEKYDQAYADLIVIRSEIDVLESTISKKTVVAPFDGVLGLYTLTEGDYVSANQILTSIVGDTEKMWVEFTVPQFYPKLANGENVAFRAMSSNIPSSFYQATIIAHNSMVDATSRSLSYRAEVNRAVVDYVPNTALEIKVPISAEKKLFKVPVTAVNQDLYGSYVFRLIEESNQNDMFRAQRAPVTVVTERDGYKYLSSGLEKGETIAATGAFKLYESLLVKALSPLLDASVSQGETAGVQ